MKIKKYIQKKNPHNYHDSWVPNLILSYQALYIFGFVDFFWIASEIFPTWDHYFNDSGTDRGP